MRGISFVGEQRRIQDAVVSAVVIDRRQSGCLRELVGQARRTVVPALAIAAGDAQRQVGLAAHLIGQLDCAVAGSKVVQRAAHANQPGIQQLLIEFNEMRLAGAAEQDSGDQRHHCGTRGKQQCQATA
ncbi:hypothetical protein D3C84_1006260 [compost metagenome]